MEITGTTSLVPFLTTSTPVRENKFTSQEGREILSQINKDRANTSDILLNSLSFVSRNVPQLSATGPLAGFRVDDALKLLTNRVERNKLPIVDDFEKKSRFTDFRQDELDNLKDTLTDLAEIVVILLNGSSFNLRSATSSREELVEVEAGKDAPISTFRVLPSRLSNENVLASNEFSTPFGALGLSGSFFVNGFKIEVETTDSIIQLRDKINFGEDKNKNSVLDGPEDINENGIIDRVFVAPSEFGPGVFTNEDLNGNGILDPKEDANNNNRLDGGTAESRVVASIQRNRLILTHQAGGSTRIDLRDDDGILLELGFFELNPKGNPVQKEFEFIPKNVAIAPTFNLIESQEQAELELDSEPIRNDFDAFTNAVEDTTLTLKEASDRESTVNIFFDATNVLEQIEVLVTRFNDSISKINDLLTESGAFDRDDDIQNIRNDLTQGNQEQINQLTDRNLSSDSIRGQIKTPAPVGITVENSEKNTVQEVFVTSTVQKIREGITSIFSNLDKDLLRRLSSFGIRTLEDNTFAIDEPELKRALEVNEEEVLDLFTNEDTGILPQLDSRLAQILEDDLGNIDFKKDRVNIQSQAPNLLAEKFREFTNNSTLSSTIQNLIAVA